MRYHFFHDPRLLLSFAPLKLQTGFMLTPPSPSPSKIHTWITSFHLPSNFGLMMTQFHLPSIFGLWTTSSTLVLQKFANSGQVLLVYSVSKQLSAYHTTNLCQIILCPEKAVTSVDTNSLFIHTPGGSYCRQFTSPPLCPLSYVRHQWTITVQSP